MNVPILTLCLLNLGLIGLLPRIFFRPGRLNPRWWATAAPFLATAALLLGALGGGLAPSLPLPVPGQALAGALCASSIGLIGFTLGTHREPLSLWHQEDDTARHLVTHGAYARIRHPFYSAFLLALLGCALAFPHPGTAAALTYACVQLNRTAAREERLLLSSSFAEEYAAYRRRTGRFWPRGWTGRET